MAHSVGDLLTLAQKYLGTPYVSGGTKPGGFDCSGFTQYVFGLVGIKLPRLSQEQYFAGSKVEPADLSPGDLIFSNWGEGLASHVAIYAGGGKLIESPRTGKSVQLVPFDANYKAHVDGYRRVTSKKGGRIDVVTPISGGVGASGTAGSGDSGGGILDWPADITGFFQDATDTLASTVRFFSAFFEPSTYVRIGAGVLGTVLLGAGLVFLVLGAQ